MESINVKFETDARNFLPQLVISWYPRHFVMTEPFIGSALSWTYLNSKSENRWKDQLYRTLMTCTLMTMRDQVLISRTLQKVWKNRPLVRRDQSVCKGPSWPASHIKTSTNLSYISYRQAPGTRRIESMFYTRQTKDIIHLSVTIDCTRSCPSKRGYCDNKTRIT